MKELEYFLFGATVGAVLALLFAPKSGKELRADIQATAEKDLAKLQEEWHAAMTKTQERLDKLQASLDKAVEPAESEEAEAA
jgi:gas vesicle protein